MPRRSLQFSGYISTLHVSDPLCKRCQWAWGSQSISTLPASCTLHSKSWGIPSKRTWVVALVPYWGSNQRTEHNYSEASVSILKDEIFSHTKAYNAVVLIEFVVDNWGKYFETRLLCYANHSENSHKTGFQYLLQKMPEIPPDSIVKVAENVFKLSSSLGNRMYGVRADVELCRRFVRDQGAFCKHQAVV